MWSGLGQTSSYTPPPPIAQGTAGRARRSGVTWRWQPCPWAEPQEDTQKGGAN